MRAAAPALWKSRRLNKDVFLATAAPEQIGEAGSRRFDVSWLVEKSGVTRGRGAEASEAAEGLGGHHTSSTNPRTRGCEIVAVGVADAPYEAYRKLFGVPPPS